MLDLNTIPGLTLEAFHGHEDLLNDMKTVFLYVDTLQRLSNEGDDQQQKERSEFLESRESRQETISKIFVNAKEEWRLVLGVVPELFRMILDVLDPSKRAKGVAGVHSEPLRPLFEMSIDVFRLVSVCIGAKRTVRYWPTEVRWLVPLVAWVETYLDALHESSALVLQVLILWLAAAVKTPFDLARFDEDGTEKTLCNRIIGIITRTIHQFSQISVSHFLVAEFYSRHDTRVHLPSLLEFVLCEDFPSRPVYFQLGSLRSIASLLESAPRDTLLQDVHGIVAKVGPVLHETEHELVKKLSVKILGRCTLVWFTPKPFKFRYRCGKRVTTIDLAKDSSDSGDHQGIDVDDEDEDFEEPPEFFNTIVQALLEALTSSLTVLRLSAAKYLAAICLRLPVDFARDLFEHLERESAEIGADDHTWHGVTLAVAEFVRRGLLPVDLMDRVVDLVIKALFYEHIKGSFSLGAHVRDAACYICWSLARAYEPSMTGAHVARLAPHLISAACFDREVNCRRAASASIQELAGRTQQFPHWIEVIARTEIHQLSKLNVTYMEIGVHLATSFPEDFVHAMVDNLIRYRVNHWDSVIRRHAAQTLGLICSKGAFRFFEAKDELERILSDLNSKNHNCRHGAILASSNLIASDSSLMPIRSELLERVLNEPIRMLAKLDNWENATLIRDGLLCAVANCAHLHEAKGQSALWLDFLFESLAKNESNDQIQQLTIEAIDGLVRHLHMEIRVEFENRILKLINGSSQYVTGTVAKLFQRFECYCPEKIVPEVVSEFCRWLTQWFSKGELRRSESVADTISTLLHLVSSNWRWLGEAIKAEVQSHVLAALDDHTITNKGDQGQPVRIAALKNLVPYAKELQDSQAKMTIVKLVAAEIAFARNRTLRLALEALSHLTPLDSIPKFTLELSPDDIVLYEQALKFLMPIQPLWMSLWSGLVPVVAESRVLLKNVSIATLVLKAQPEVDGILTGFLDLFEMKAKCVRLSIPCLITAQHVLLSLPTSDAFQRRLAVVAWSACEKVTNPRKHLAACDLFCALVPLGQLKLALPYLYVLLGYRVPRVRSYTATELYAALLALDEHEEEVMQVGLLLQETNWLELGEAKMARDRVRTVLRSICS